jgi:hypothetical protein
MRTQIANHLNNRCQTIRSAINTLNKAARELRPPKAPIKYGSVMDMVFVAQFDLLQHSRSGKDIRKEPWADPATRLLTDKYFELIRAREEITRLNVEWKRVGTWLRDENRLYTKVIDNLSSNGTDPLLVDALRRKWERTQRIHRTTWYWLSRIRSLPSFSGSISPGHAIRPEYRNIVFPGEEEVEIPASNSEPSAFDASDGNNANEDTLATAVGLEGCLDDNQQFDALVHSLGVISS